jgi:hypothetical protein
VIEYLPIVFIIVLIAIGLSPVIMYEIQSRRKKDKEDDSSEE